MARNGTSAPADGRRTSSRVPALSGHYVFADYGSGNIWSFDASESAPSVTRIAGEGGIVGFGHDPSNGDVLLADIDNGIIRRLTVETDSSPFPPTLSATGLFPDTFALMRPPTRWKPAPVRGST